MMGARIKGVAVPAILIAGNLALAWFIAPYLNGAASPASSMGSAPAAVPGPVMPDPVTTPRRLSPIRSFSATTERPLFVVSRRKAEPVTTAPVATIQKPFDLKLQGILFSADSRLAVVSNNSGRDTLRLAEGTEYRGWTLAKIEPKAVVFQSDTTERRLILSYGGSQPGIQRTASPAGGSNYLAPLRAMPESELAAVLSQPREAESN